MILILFFYIFTIFFVTFLFVMSFSLIEYKYFLIIFNLKGCTFLTINNLQLFVILFFGDFVYYFLTLVKYEMRPKHVCHKHKVFFFIFLLPIYSE